jgi:predicted nucleotidyltransferase
MRPSEIVAAQVDQMRKIIGRYPVRNPQLFGSAARGDDTEESDIDILVEPLRGTTYFTLAKLELELEALLGVQVDVATPGAIGPSLAERMARDLRPL